MGTWVDVPFTELGWLKEENSWEKVKSSDMLNFIYL